MMDDAAAALLLVGILTSGLGIVRVVGALKALSRIPGSSRHLSRFMAALKVAGASLLLVGALALVFLVLAVAIAVAIAVLPVAWSLFVAAWLTIWDSIADAYRTDRIVKFIVWIGAALVAGFLTLLVPSWLLLGVSLCWEWVSDQVAAFRRALDSKGSEGGSLDAMIVGADADDRRRKAQRAGRLWLVVTIVGLMLLSAGVILAHQNVG